MKIGMRRSLRLSSAAVLALALAPSASVAGGISDTAEDVPCLYVVQEGDSLSSIAKQFFGSADDWQRIADLNELEDPTALTAGDTLALRDCPEEGVAVPAEEAPATEETLGADEDGSDLGFEYVEEGDVYYVTQTAYTYLAPRPSRPIAQIIGSRDNLNFFGQTSKVYINAGKNSELRAGDRFTVYRDQEPVAHPVNGQFVGYLTRILGDLVVERVDDESAICRVERGADTIVPGDKVRPYIQVPLEVRPVANEVEQDGLLLGTSGQDQDLVEFRSFFVDKGEEDGIQVGNIVSVYRPGALVEDPATGRALAQPDEVVGKAIVFRVERDTSSAFVFQSNRNLRPADRVSFEVN